MNKVTYDAQRLSPSGDAPALQDYADLPRASPGERLLAYAVDIIPITVLSFAIVVACDPTSADDMRSTEFRFGWKYVIQGVAIAILAIYSTILEALPTRGTIGKRLVGQIRG